MGDGTDLSRLSVIGHLGSAGSVENEQLRGLVETRQRVALGKVERSVWSRHEVRLKRIPKLWGAAPIVQGKDASPAHSILNHQVVLVTERQRIVPVFLPPTVNVPAVETRPRLLAGWVQLITLLLPGANVGIRWVGDDSGIRVGSELPCYRRVWRWVRSLHTTFHAVVREPKDRFRRPGQIGVGRACH